MTTQQSQPTKANKPRTKPKDPPKVKIIVPPDLADAEITAEQREGERRQEENDRRHGDAMAFAVEQLTAPQTKPLEPPQLAPPKAALDLYNQRLAALNAQFGVQTAPQQTAKQSRNGITRPGADTRTGKVWACADSITIANHRSATIAELKAHPDLRVVNVNTIKTQYARWRQYNGVQGRQSATMPARKIMSHDGNP